MTTTQILQRIYISFFCIFIALNLVNGQQRFHIAGTVTDSDNEPLIGANVYISGTTIGAATNKSGSFTINNLKAGDYQLCVSYAGFKKYRQDIYVNSNLQGITILMEKTSGHLGEIVITGTGTPHHLKTAPVPTELLTSKMIELTAAPDFINLMGTISPSFDFSPGTMGSFMQLNGLSNDFIVILIDGHRVYGDMGGMNDLGRINPNNVERIEVVKGASSSLYGSDAIAGVINIITKKSNRGVSISNNSQYSNFNTLQQTYNIDFNTMRLSGHSSFSLKQSDGWKNSAFEYDKNDSLVQTDAMTQNPYVNKSIRQGLKFRATDKLSIMGGGSYYVNDIRVPQEVKDYGYYFKDLSYNLGASYFISKTSKIFFDYTSDNYKYYYKYNKNVEDGDLKKNELAINNDQQRQDYNLKWTREIGNYQTLTLGSELVHEIYRSEERLENSIARVSTLSVYAQDEITLFKALMLTAGLRAVGHNNFGTIATPKLSVLYKLKRFNLRGTYSRGFKAPTLKEQYYYYEKRGTLYLGNKSLDPQKSNYYSLGADYHNSWFSANLSAYQNEIDGLIAYQTIDTLPGDGAYGIKKRRKHYNINKARSKGVDIMFDIKLPYGFSLGGGYSYVDAQNLTDKVRLEYVAQNYWNIRSRYFHTWKKYQLNIQLLGRIQDEKFFEDDNAKAYQLWKLVTAHKFAEFNGTDLSFTLSIDNVFDYVDNSPYGSHYGTINPGRTFLVGLNLVFAR